MDEEDKEDEEDRESWLARLKRSEELSPSSRFCRPLGFRLPVSEEDEEDGDEEKDEEDKESCKMTSQREFITRMVDFIELRDKGLPPPDPYPKVNWEGLEPHLKKQLPVFEQCTISGCPLDPYVYPDHPDPKGRVMICSQDQLHNGGPDSTPEEQRLMELLPDSSGKKLKVRTYKLNRAGYGQEMVKVLLKEQEYRCVEYNPFGFALGLQTSLGVVAPPAHPVNGYI